MTHPSHQDPQNWPEPPVNFQPPLNGWHPPPEAPNADNFLDGGRRDPSSPPQSRNLRAQNVGQQASQTVRFLFGLGSQIAETVQEDPELSRVGLWGATVLSLGILLVWQWRLGLAVMVGSGTLFVLYAMQMPGGGQRWQQVLRLFNPRQPLVIASCGGAVATLSTYLVTSIWAEAEQRWLATGAILQGFLSLGILGLLGWEWWQRQQGQGQAQFEDHLRDVAAPDPFRRLAGVRRLQGILERQAASAEQLRLGLDFLRLALGQEREPVVREALLEALTVVGGATPPPLLTRRDAVEP